jgi:hypothetical protein
VTQEHKFSSLDLPDHVTAEFIAQIESEVHKAVRDCLIRTLGETRDEYHKKAITSRIVAPQSSMLYRMLADAMHSWAQHLKPKRG